VYGTTFKPVLDIVLLSAKLAAVVGVTGPFTMYLYYAISAFILRLIMPSFPRLTAEQQRLEGDYRYVHSRAINYAEEIAFFAGQKKERQVMDVSFDRLYRHMRNIFTKQAWLGVIDSWLVKYGATMIGYAVVAGPVFGSIGQGKTQGNLDTSKITGDYVRNSHILINLARAIGQLIVLYKNITQLAGYTARVSELREVLTHYTTSAVTSALDDDTVIGDGPTAKRLIGEQIAFHDVAVVSPDGVLLLDSKCQHVCIVSDSPNHVRRPHLRSGPRHQSAHFRPERQRQVECVPHHVRSLAPQARHCHAPPREHHVLHPTEALFDHWHSARSDQLSRYQGTYSMMTRDTC
jgi:ABC-type uncharacterized transport system fused permease/ATPase subunit